MRQAEKRNKTAKHFENLGHLLGKSPSEVSEFYRELKLIESRGHKLAEQYCNGEIDSEAWEKYTDKLKERLKKIIPEEVLNNVIFNSDARGYFLKLDDQYVRDNNISIERDWGGYGILCPDEV